MLDFAYGFLLTIGVLSHITYFRVGEHHLYGLRYLFLVVAIFVLSTSLQTYIFGLAQIKSSLKSLSFISAYFCGLYTSLVAYRVFLHPLRRFPGPFWCRLSSLWFPTYLSNHDAFRQLDNLHKIHGHFVRVGSNDLSISHPKAVQAVFGLGTKCIKSDWYDLTYPMISLQSTRDQSIHARRRRVWSAVFGDRHLNGYDQRMARYRALLLDAIDQSGGREMDVAKWFNLFTFDVMGDLAFGTSFGMLETSKEHDAIKVLNSGLYGLGFKLPMWSFRIMVGIPGMARDWWSFIRYCNEQLDNRIQMKPETQDIMGALLQASKDEVPTAFDRNILEGDSQLIVVAGSDTTSTTLSTIFRFLAQFPHHVGILRAELEGLPRTELGDYNHIDLASLQHLNSVINESLRLFPPVATVIPRLTPPEGLDIEGTFIPGNVTVSCPQYVLGRNPECYVNPDDFIPERWYSRPDLLRDTSGFAPFSAGHYSCIGRPLAMRNLRATVSRIIVNYDIYVSIPESLSEYDKHMAEHFTLAPPQLRMSFIRVTKLE